jgi:ubiquinone/menaquinone biosynthesis C-methylase UbiE
MKLMANVFDEMGVYWEEIADENQTESQIKFLKNQLSSDGYVLDLACGTGRHSIPLSQQGYSMVGLDISGKLLKIAKKRWSQLQVVSGDMRFLPFKAGAFAAAISMDTSFGYLRSEADDRVSLAEVRRVMLEQAVFVIDVFNPEELTLKYRNKKHSSKLKEYPSFFLQQRRTLSQSGDWLGDLWKVHDKVSGRVGVFDHSVRLYRRDELDSLLENAGFSVNHVCGSYEGENFSANSSRLILVAGAE